MELDGWAAASVIIKIAVYAGAFVAAGTGLFRAVFAAQAVPLGQLVSRTLVIAAVCGSIATLVQMGTQAGMLAGGGLSGMIDGEMLDLIRQTPAGDAYFARLAGLGLLVLSAALTGHFATAASGFGALAVCASFCLSGHTSEGSPYPLQALLTVHLLGISYWVGALMPLRAAAAGGLPLAETAELAERFGRLAAWIVGALVVAGVLVAWALLGTPLALVTSAYGRLLGLKLLVVGALLALAAGNKLRLTPAMRRGDVAAGKKLVRSINFEMALVLVILGATAALTTVMSLPA